MTDTNTRPQHTPGPWTLTVGCYPRDSVWDADGQREVCPMVWGNDAEEIDANARLIAAAPDLLAALENAAASVAVHAATARHAALAGINPVANNGLAAELERNVEHYRAAITKARGEG